MLFLNLLIILFLWKAAFKEIKSDNGAPKYFSFYFRKTNYLSSSIPIFRPKNGKKFPKFSNKKVTTDQNFKYGRDGPISKTPVYCSQNGQTKNWKPFTRAIQNSVQSGASSSEPSRGGICLLIKQNLKQNKKQILRKHQDFSPLRGKLL